MSKRGPILFVEADEDDQDVLRLVCKELALTNKLLFFKTGGAVLDYLLQTKEKPFGIFCEVNLPGMSGLELNDTINKNQQLKQKSIPFIYFTSNADIGTIRQAYQYIVQGYFIKEDSPEKIKAQFAAIYQYWQFSLTPKEMEG